MDVQLSEDLQRFLGVETCPRTEVVKRLWAHIKSNNLQNPKDKRIILCDDAFYSIFKRKTVHMMKVID